MNATITRGEFCINQQFSDFNVQDTFLQFTVALFARHKYMSVETLSENLQGLVEMMAETASKNSLPDISILKRKVTRFCNAISKMKGGQEIQAIVWNFILALEGNGNLNGFGFCGMPFKDPVAGNAEKISLYELKKKIAL